MNQSINVSGGSIIRGILFVVLLIFLYYVRDIVLVILAAVVIASSLEPLTRWFGKYKIRRLPAVVFVYLLVGLVLGSFFLFFVPLLLGETVTFLNNIPSTINLSDIWNPIKDTGILSNSSFSVQDVVSNLKDVLSGSGEGAFRTASAIFGGALSFFLIIILSFYLSVQEDGVGTFLRLITPIRMHTYVTDLWRRSQLKIGHWMQGQLLLAVMIGVLVYLGLMILGVQHALLLAFIAAVFELIPVFGPIMSAIPAVMIAFGTGNVSEGFLVIGLYIIIHQFENNLLYPLVVKKIVGISPIIVILAIVLGAKLAGFLGAILAVPLAAAFMEYVNDVEKHKTSMPPVA
jgi:predicted PurR-regulated permease PerM